MQNNIVRCRRSLAVTLVFLLTCLSGAAQTIDDTARENLRSRLESAGTPPAVQVLGERILAQIALPRFYEDRAFRLAWVRSGQPAIQAKQLLDALRNAPKEGLHLGGYHIKQIEQVLSDIQRGGQASDMRRTRELVDFDLLMTDAFLLFGSHLLSGRINPKTIDPEWHASRKEADMAAVLQRALMTNDLESTLEGLKPPQKGYLALRTALESYRQVEAAGGWKPVPEDIHLEPGLEGSGVERLIERLYATGDLKEKVSNSAWVTEDVIQAVKVFQRRHGLEEDGVLGSHTLAALNVTVQERISQLEINMERYRWLPQDLGIRHILVNIARFELDVVENEESVLNMRVVVGRQYRRTPVFSGLITYLVLCPSWHVPRNIAVQDKLPEIQKDVTYLARQNMQVVSGTGSEGVVRDAGSIDWTQVDAASFNYKLIQAPGPNNALGRVKFMFPNAHNVYLHDTPSRELFSRANRTGSSGCIRLEKPLDLAEVLLASDSVWTRDAIEGAVNRWREQTVMLREPVPVHIQYWTAWADEKSGVQFRQDIYNRDGRVAYALTELAQANP